MNTPQTIQKTIQIENVGHQDTVTVHLDLDVSCDSPAGSYTTTAPAKSKTRK